MRVLHDVILDYFSVEKFGKNHALCL